MRDLVQQKGVDVKIAVDMVVYAFKDRYDAALLVCGDADLEEAVNEVRAVGKLVINTFTRTGWSHNLRRAADLRLLLDQSLLEQCWAEETSPPEP